MVIHMYLIYSSLQNSYSQSSISNVAVGGDMAEFCLTLENLMGFDLTLLPDNYVNT